VKLLPIILAVLLPLVVALRAQAQETSDAFCDRCLAGMGKSWSPKDFAAFLPSPNEPVKPMCDEISKYMGPLKKVERKQKLKETDSITLTGLMHTCSYVADLDCAKGKATAKIAMAMHDGRWIVTFIDVDSPLMHPPEVMAVENSAKQYVKSILPSLLEWRSERLIELSTENLRKDISPGMITTNAMMFSFKQTLGKPKTYEDAHIVGQGFHGKDHVMDVEIPVVFANGPANVELELVGSTNGWQINEFHINKRF